MKITFRIGRKAPLGVAYMVTHGIYDGYAVICVCADQADARKRARAYNRDNPGAWEDERARVEEVAYIPARQVVT
jgi:hypothetical protein